MQWDGFSFVIFKNNKFCGALVFFSREWLVILVFWCLSLLPSNASIAFLQKEVAEFTCTCERHIGTQSGGMDQVMAKSRFTVLYKFVFNTSFAIQIWEH